MDGDGTEDDERWLTVLSASGIHVVMAPTLHLRGSISSSTKNKSIPSLASAGRVLVLFDFHHVQASCKTTSLHNATREGNANM